MSRQQWRAVLADVTRTKAGRIAAWVLKWVVGPALFLLFITNDAVHRFLSQPLPEAVEAVGSVLAVIGVLFIVVSVIVVVLWSRQ